MTTMIQSRVSLAVCALALAGAVACGDESDGDGNEATTPVAAELQRVLDEAVSDSDALLPGAIGYYRDPGFAPWSGSAGVSDMQGHVSMKGGDRVRAGSIVKTLLATVTLQHVEEGTLSLDQRLPELLPRSTTDRVPNAESITLRMLLNHTSGIPDWITPEVEVRVATDPAYVWTTDEALDLLAEQPAWFPPGSSLRYSNSNFTLVGLLLDRLEQGDWRTQIRERVLEPVGMRATYLPEPGDRELPDAHAHGYVQIEDTIMDTSQVDPSMAGAAGGNAMITSAPDLARFLDALLDGELFERAETLEAMTTLIEAEHESGLPWAYGLGIESLEMPNGTKVIGHAGGAVGYATMMFRVPDSGGTLVTTVNTGDLFTNALSVFTPALEVIAARNARE